MIGRKNVKNTNQGVAMMMMVGLSSFFSEQVWQGARPTIHPSIVPPCSRAVPLFPKKAVPSVINDGTDPDSSCLFPKTSEVCERGNFPL